MTIRKYHANKYDASAQATEAIPGTLGMACGKQRLRRVLVFDGEVAGEHSTVFRATFRDNEVMVMFDYFPADGQAHARVGPRVWRRWKMAKIFSA